MPTSPIPFASTPPRRTETSCALTEVSNFNSALYDKTAMHSLFWLLTFVFNPILDILAVSLTDTPFISTLPSKLISLSENATSLVSLFSLTTSSPSTGTKFDTSIFVEFSMSTLTIAPSVSTSDDLILVTLFLTSTETTFLTIGISFKNTATISLSKISIGQFKTTIL